ncbi:MAG: response regulator transcription factor [Caldilineales bacterium]
MSLQILVVDDDKHIVRLIRTYLEQAGFAVITAHDGETALHILRRERPSLMVLDLMLPGRDGWDLTRTVRSDPTLAATPIIMVTARVDDADRVLGLELGADDYVPKPFSPREIVARVRAVLRRTGGVGITAPRVLQLDALLLDPDRHEATLHGKLLDLTPTEFALLYTLLANTGHAFTRSELIEQALGYSYEGLERTVDSHIKNLRRKIEADPTHPRLLHTVYGVGYRLHLEDGT